METTVDTPVPSDATTSLATVQTAAKFAAETLFPGGANAIKGDFKTAGIYALVGLAARATFGFPALLLVSADSFAKATTGNTLREHIGLSKRLQPPEA